jgi:hypothetical protein
MSFNFLATSNAVLKLFCLIIASRSLEVRLTVSLASFSEPEIPVIPPPLGEVDPCFVELIYCMKAPGPLPEVGSVAWAFE